MAGHHHVANVPEPVGHPSDIPIVITVGDDSFQIPSSYLNSWLYKEKTQVTREMVLAILLDFSTMSLPQFPKVHNAYWANFVSLYQLLCFMVVVTQDGPKKLSFKSYKERYNQLTLEGSEDTTYKQEIHWRIYHNFTDMVEDYNSDGSMKHGASPVNLSNISHLNTFKHPKTCTLEHYINKRKIKENCEWDRKVGLNLDQVVQFGFIETKNI